MTDERRRREETKDPTDESAKMRVGHWHRRDRLKIASAHEAGAVRAGSREDRGEGVRRSRCADSRRYTPAPTVRRIYSPDGESSWIAHGVGAAGRIALHGGGALVHDAFALGARCAARHEVAWRQCAGATVGVALGQDRLYVQTVGGFVRLAVGMEESGGEKEIDDIESAKRAI